MENSLIKPDVKDSSSTESNAIINEFMWSHPVGVLALVDSGKKPHASTIYYSVKDGFVITITTKSQTKKGKLLKKNKPVMLVSYDAPTQTTLQVTGYVVPIKSFYEIQEAFDDIVEIARRTSDDVVPPISKLYAGKYKHYQIVPREIHMSVFAANDPEKDDLYRSITFDT